MPASGDIVLASQVSTRIATTPILVDSATWTTTEISLATVTATLTTGLLYRVACLIPFSSTSAGELMNLRIREDLVGGNQIQGVNVYAATTSAVGFLGHAITEYTALASASKTFHLTGSRVTALGTCQARAGSARPAYFTIDLIQS